MANASLRAAAPASTLTPVEFHGATLSVILINGVPHVALRPICEDIGIDWAGQHARIKRHPVLSACVSVTRTQMPDDSTVCVTKTVARDGKNREMLFLPLDKLDGWLFGVSVGRVRPELRERLTRYQAECFDVLARHFGAAAPHQDSSFADPVNIHALPAPDSIDVRALLLSGQSEPVPLTPAQQALIDARAWAMAHEAYELSREHLARRVAYRTPCIRTDGASLADVKRVVDGMTLGKALAQKYHDEVQLSLSLLRHASEFAAGSVAAMERVLAAAAQGQGAGANPLKQDI